jgi:succinyl-diaminopimelate desuccinylase
MEHANSKLYVEKDSYLVKTLTDIFKSETGIDAEPIAIGGGTYARAFKNCVSFGMNFPGDKDMCHQVDEFVDIDKLIMGAKIYATAIYELAK